MACSAMARASGNCTCPLTGQCSRKSLMRSAGGQLTNLSRTYFGGEDQAVDSYKLNWTAPDSRAGSSVASAGDFDGDGLSDILVGAPAGDSEDSEPPGLAYLFLGSSLSRLDSGSGLANGQIELGDSLPDQGAWQFVGEADASEAGASVASVSDHNGGAALLVGSPGLGSQATRAGAAYFISTAAPAAADAEDGMADGVVSLGHIAAQPGSWKFVGEAPYDVAGSSVAAAGDIDGDGVDDILIGAPGERPDDTDEEISLPGAFYLASGASLPQADQSDGQADGVIGIGQPRPTAQFVEVRWRARLQLGRREPGIGRRLERRWPFGGAGRCSGLRWRTGVKHWRCLPDFPI